MTRDNKMVSKDELIGSHEAWVKFILSAKGSEKVGTKDELQCHHNQWVDSVLHAKAIHEEAQFGAAKQTRIQRVPSMLLREPKDSETYFAPRVVSIGPYHYFNPKLQQLKNLKLLIAYKFLSEGRELEDVHIEYVYNRVLERIKEVRDCYEANSTDEFKDEELARMMVMDGCFILYYSHCALHRNDKGMKMKNYQIPLVQQDLFLLENQLPWFVLVLLTENRRKDWLAEVESFIKDIIVGTEKAWWERISEDKPTRQREETTVQVQEQSAQKAHPLHLLALMHTTIVGDKPPPLCEANWYTFRNVKELMEVGIHPKPSGSSFLTEIRYTSRPFTGHLKLPTITIDDSTRARFMNLIAYEMCPDNHDNFFWVTSYICFLDSLIDHPDDVKELRSAKILNNALGSDEEVANLFNEIGKDLVPHPCAYSDVKKRIYKHYTNKPLRYMAQFKHQYFRNPWSIFALFGAILVLFLSGVQAYFQVWSLPSECDGVCAYIAKTHNI